MTYLKTLFLETSWLTTECHPWNLPKGSRLTLATDVSPMTLEYFPAFHSTRSPPTKRKAITGLLFCQKTLTFCWCPQPSCSLSTVGTNLFLLGRQSSFCSKHPLVCHDVTGWVMAHIHLSLFLVLKMGYLVLQIAIIKEQVAKGILASWNLCPCEWSNSKRGSHPVSA